MFVSVKCPRLCTFHWHLRFFERYQCYLHHVSETRRHVAPFIQTRPLCLTLLSGCCIQSQHLCLGSPILVNFFLTPFPAGKSSSETTPPRNQVLMSLSLKRTGDLNGAIRYLNRCLSGSPQGETDSGALRAAFSRIGEGKNWGKKIRL